MKAIMASQARLPSSRRTISAIDRAPWRTEATRLEKSWTAPMNTTPTVTQRMQGSQPNCWQARIGPATGPAAAIALKCCPRR